MTQYEVQTVECGGIPITEYCYEDQDQVLITIEFNGEVAGQYQYSIPEFIFTDSVCLRQQVQEYLESELHPKLKIETGKVLGLELVEFRSQSGLLTSEPHWLVGVRWGNTLQLKWYYECELIAARDLKPPVFEEF